MKKIAVIYGSTTDNTKTVAEKIVGKLGKENASLFSADKISIADLESYPNLVLGTSTWGDGDLQDDWEDFLPKLKDANLEGKTVALFGLGDSGSYPDTFSNGMGHIYEAIKDKGCKLVGQTSTESYTFDASISVVDGQFVGLAIDEDNESDLTDDRISAFVEKISAHF